MILVYFLPVLLFIVFAPKPCEGTHRIDTQEKGQQNSKQDRPTEGRLRSSEIENTRVNNRKRHDHVSSRRRQKDDTDGQISENAEAGGQQFKTLAESSGEQLEATSNDRVKENKEGIQTEETIQSPTAPVQPPPTKCQTCRDKNSERQAKIELLKQHLLGKLGLSSVPKVKGPLPPLPFDFYLGDDFTVSDERDAEDEEESRPVTRQIFVYGEDITDKCYQRKGTGCYSFNISQEFIDPIRVSSIELWVYKQVDRNDHHIQTFMVSELGPFIRDGKEMLRFRNIVKRMETRLKAGWMKIYVKRSVLRWLTKPHKNHGLAIVCKTCQRQNHRTIYGDKEGLGPLLVFYMKRHNPNRRTKRYTQCIEGGDNCCHKESLEINFRDIGWDYIMAPTSIRPNFCTGSCNGIQAAYYNHTRFVQTLQQQVTSNFGPIQTCCSPVSFRRPQSLLYRDHVGVVRKVDVPDLIVGECGCT